MEQYQDDIKQVKILLRDHPKGLSITDIADQTHINRNSVAKYMDILQAQGSVDGYKVGTSKLYILSSRLPSSAIAEVCTRPFLIIDKQECITETNKQMIELLGISREKITAHEFENLPLKIVESGRDKRSIRGALRGTPLRTLGRITHFSGRLQEVSIILEPVVFESGMPGAALIIEGQESQALQPDIHSAFSDILALLDDEMEYVVRHTPEGTIRFVNETYCTAAGKTKEDLMNQPFRPLTSMGDTAAIRDHFANLSPENPIGIIEFRAVMADGEVRWQRWKNRALFNDRGELTGYQSCGLDITDLMAMKNELARVEERVNETVLRKTEDLRATNRQLYAEISNRDKLEQRLLRTQYLMDNSSDMVFLVNKNGRIQFANKRAEDILGYAEEGLHDHQFSSVFPHIGQDPLDDLLVRLKNGGTIKDSSDLVTRDHRRIPTEILYLYLRYHGDDYICCSAREQSAGSDLSRDAHSGIPKSATDEKIQGSLG